jgi:hypothetical protein
MVISSAVGPGMGGFGTGVKIIELLIFIIKTTEQAHKLRDECDEVRTAAAALKEGLEANKDVLNDEKAVAKLESVLEQVCKFVGECKNANILRRAWEITWEQRLPALLKQMMTWIAILNVGVSVIPAFPCSTRG